MKLHKLLMMFFVLFMMISSALIYTGAVSDTNPTLLQDDSTDEEDNDDTDEDDGEDEDSDDDGIDDDTETAFEREVEIESQEREFHAKSELKNGERKDKFEVEFKVGGGDEPELEFEYSTETDDVESELEYRINFDGIIEFTETNSTAVGFDEDDVVESSYDLGKADFDPLEYTTSTLNGTLIHTIVASTTDGVFSIILKISDSFVKLNNTMITPNAVKFDIIISGYDYVTTGSYLALQTDIKTESEYEYEEDTEEEQAGFSSGESQVEIGNAQATGFFSWIKTAEADNQVIDVISSDVKQSEEQDDDLEEGETHSIMFFTFDAQNPIEIVWDPKVGVSNSALVAGLNSSDASGLPVFQIWFAVLTLFSLGYYLRRKNY